MSDRIEHVRSARQEAAWDAESADRVPADESLRRLLDAERARTKRSMVWMIAVLLFVAMLVLTLFLSLGVFMLRNGRRTATLVEDGQANLALQKLELLQISNEVQRVLRETSTLGRQFSDLRADAAKDREQLRLELQRFGDWVGAKLETASGTAGDPLTLQTLKDRLAAAEAELAKTTETQERTVGILAELGSQVSGVGVLASNVAARAALGGGRMNADAAISAAFEDLENYMPASKGEDPFMVEDVRVESPSDAQQGEVKVQVFPNGERYEGGFSDGLMNGWGRYFYASGDHYEGGFATDLKSGSGTMTYANGDVYAGEFRNDMKDGRGTYVFRNGDRYTGQFQNDMINGNGVLLYENGNKYAGGFKNGLRHGNGHLRFANGDVYKGNFVDDLRFGKGMYIFADGGRYIGEFRDGQRHGRGRYIYPEGDEYMGQWENGRKHGQGICTYRDGRRMEGVWHEDHLVAEQPDASVLSSPSRSEKPR